MRSARVTGGLNWLTEKILLRLLRYVKQPWSRPFMEAMASLIPVLTVEAVILRRSPEGSIEVLLLERPSDDIHWASTLCIPGTVVRATDQPTPDWRRLQGVVNRLALNELGESFARADYVDLYHYGAGGRANSIQVVFLCELNGATRQNGWYPVDDLPARFLKGQQPLIDMAIARFTA